MSHFLQRVVAAAHNPGGTVHPLLGSVYSRATPEPVPPRARAPDLPRAEDVSDRAPPSRLAPIANVAIEDSAPLPPSRLAERRSAHDPASPEVPAHRRDFEPLMPPHTRSGLQTPLSESEAHSSALRRDEPARADEPAFLESEFPVESEFLRGDRDAGSRRLPEPNLPLTSPLSSPPSRRTPKDDRPRSQEPDDIQIHIGRIEVTAAPSPVQNRAPAAPRRAGPSLDEFLKRRGGRQ